MTGVPLEVRVMCQCACPACLRCVCCVCVRLRPHDRRAPSRSDGGGEVRPCVCSPLLPPASPPDVCVRGGGALGVCAHVRCVRVVCVPRVPRGFVARRIRSRPREGSVCGLPPPTSNLPPPAPHLPHPTAGVPPAPHACLQADGHLPPPPRVTPTWRASFEARLAMANVVVALAKVGTTSSNNEFRIDTVHDSWWYGW